MKNCISAEKGEQREPGQAEGQQQDEDVLCRVSKTRDGWNRKASELRQNRLRIESESSQYCVRIILDFRQNYVSIANLPFSIGWKI
jgi:hypothetical protein